MAASLSAAANLVASPLTARPRRQVVSQQRQRRVVLAAAGQRGDVDLSDEYAAVESLASQDDVLLFYNHQHEAKNTRLHEVMQTNLVLCSPETTVADAAKLLDGPPSIEGLPVVDATKKLVGVLSRKDLRTKTGATVADVMLAPPIALKASGKVADAALCMTEHKFHRVPVVDDELKCVGVVTRSDIFWALTQSDQEDGEDSPLSQHGLSL